jgi:uroporphyrinogen decarboxylase
LDAIPWQFDLTSSDDSCRREALNAGLADFSCAVTRQLASLGVDGIRFGDDWGFQASLMTRLERWRRLYRKHYQRIYEAARQAGLFVAIHSCGNITDLLPDLIEIGVQVVHPLQPEAMDVAFCHREFGCECTVARIKSVQEN